MLSSMTPTIITKNDSIQYILGTPGGATIITTITQSVINLIDYKMSLRQAVCAPRFHHQWYPDKIYVEQFGFNPTLKISLMDMGYEVKDRSSIGDLNAIAVDENGIYYGVADTRRQSAVSSY